MQDPNPQDYSTYRDVNKEDEFERDDSRLRSCLFLVITILLVLSLAGSSILTIILVNRTERATPAPVEDRAAFEFVEPISTAEIIESVQASTPTAETSETTQPPASARSVPLDVNRIVIINREGQVETISPDGADRRALTSIIDSRIYQFPAWAPDGRQLAVIGNDRSGSGIFLFDDRESSDVAQGKELYFSADKPPIYMYWSPDSEHLAFLANQPRSTIGLNVVRGDGQGESRMLASGSPFYWDWTDDSRQLLIHAGVRNSTDRLALIDLDGSIQTDLPARPGVFQAPGIAPSGRYWAYAEETTRNTSSLAVADSQTGERRQFDQAGSIALSWSPTQDQIAFTNGAVDGHPLWGPLYLLDVATGETRLLSARTVIAFFWSPDGRQIAFITLNRDNNNNDINAGSPAKTRAVSRIDSNIQQQERGFLSLSVIDTTTGRGLRLLDFVPTPIFVSQFLPYFDQYALSHRLWSPDSSAIVLPVREERSSIILVIPLTGGRPLRLSEGEIAFWSQR